MARLWADVGLNAEPFFSRNGFAVKARQQVALRGQVLANARIGSKLLFASLLIAASAVCTRAGGRFGLYS